MLHRLPLMAAALLLLAAPARAQDTTVPPVIEAIEVFAGSNTVLGQPVPFPTEEPGVRAFRLTIPPGLETGWHWHAAPLFAYIIEGELVVDYGADGERTYRAGEAFLEALGTAHNGRNDTDRPIVLLAVYLTGDGNSISAPAEPPPGR